MIRSIGEIPFFFIFLQAPEFFAMDLDNTYNFVDIKEDTYEYCSNL